MADKDFVVKNGLVVGTNFIANSTQFSLSTINSTSNGFFSNSTVIQIGNSSVNSSINSTSFSGTSANALNLGGQLPAYYTNAGNLSTGTIPYERIPSNVINTTAVFTRTAVTTFNSNISIATSASIVANGTIGTNAQVLTSNGTSVYWGTGIAGTNTSIQFNDSGVANAASAFTFNKSNNTVTFGSSPTYTYANATTFAFVNSSVTTVVNASYYTGTSYNSLNSNNTTYAFGKAEASLNVNNATYLGGKTEGNLNANNATYLGGKTEGNLNANNTTYAFGKAEGNLNVNNAVYLSGYPLSGTRNNVANQVVRTDAFGYIQTGFINILPDENLASNPARVYGQNGDGYVRTYQPGSLNVNYAASSGLAAKASTLSNSGGNGSAMQFNWSGLGGQPTWLWGGNDGINMYVYNPSNFSVNYSNSSNLANYISSADQGYRPVWIAAQGADALTSAGGGGGFEVRGAGGGAGAFIAFHRPGSYAAYFGLDYDNQFSVGGWSSGGGGLTWFKCGGLGVGRSAVGAGQVWATDNIVAYNSSDIRLKDNIEVIPNALDKVSKIRGVFFDWNDEYINKNGGEDPYFNRKHDVGVIAQEIIEVLPEVVGERENGILAVRYEKIVPLLIEAIKELKAEIDQLKGK